MENLTGGTPPVRYLPCVVPCKLYFTAVETLDFDRVSEFVTKIKKYDSLLEDEFGDKAMEVRQKITEIDALVQKKENPSKVKMLLMDLKNLSIGVTGSLIATGIVEGIKLLFI